MMREKKKEINYAKKKKTKNKEIIEKRNELTVNRYLDEKKSSTTFFCVLKTDLLIISTDASRHTMCIYLYMYFIL